MGEAMKQSATVVRACQVLRAKILLEDASLQLPGTSPGGDDTETIREAMRLYVNTWVMPILNAMEKGDTKALQRLTVNEPARPMPQ